MNAERDDDPSMRRLDDAYRAASVMLDERPDPRVRASVLAAAARASDAKPRDAASPFRPRRRGWSIAALLVVSVLSGLVAIRFDRERPDLGDDRGTSRVEAPAAAPAANEAAAPQGAPPAANEPSASRDAAGTVRAAREPVRRPGHAARVVPRTAPTPVRPFADVAQRPLEQTVPASPPASSSAAPSPSADAAANVAGPAPAPRATTDERFARSTAGDATARAKARVSTVDDVVEDDPARWAARIARLRVAGRDDEADRELATLRARYPSFAVPRDALRVDRAH